MFASGTIDRHLLDGITIFGLLLGILGSFYLAYDVFRLPILQKLTWSLTCALPPAVIAMSVVGAFGFTSVQHQADVLKDMLISGLYWGLFGAGTAYYTLRSQPYESRLQEIFSVTDTLRGLVAGAILGLGLTLWNGRFDQVISNVLFGSLVTGTLCSCLGYLRSKRLGPIVLLFSVLMGGIVGLGLDQIGIHVASGPDAPTFTFAYGVFLGLAAPICTWRRLPAGQQPSQVSSKQGGKAIPAPSQLPSHQTKKQRHRKSLVSSTQQNAVSHSTKSHSPGHPSNTPKQLAPKQQPSAQKPPDHQAQEDEAQQEAPQHVQPRPSFYSRADALRGLVYGAMLSGLAGAYFVNQHTHFGSGLVAVTALFGGLLAMTITGISRFIVWWADQLKNRQLGKIGLTLLELGVVLTLIQPLADLLDLVH